MPLVRGTQRPGKCFLRLMHGNARCAQPRFHAAVGIADQHTLPAVARLEVGAIDRILQQRPHDLPAVAQGIHGIEHRRDVQWHRARACLVDARPAS